MFLLLNVKMPTIVDIFTFVSRKISCSAELSMKIRKAPHGSTSAWLQLLLENSKSQKGHNYVKKILRVTCPTDMIVNISLSFK